MLFEQVATGGCQSYLIGCAESCAAALIDPEISQIDRYQALAARHGLRFHYVIDTHTHADHFSAAQQIGRQLNVPIVMHQASPQPFANMRVGDRELIVLGKLRIQVLHTPGHTRDSMCLQVQDRVFTGDTLLIGDPDFIVLDVRERDAYDEGHVPGARLLPRGQLELRVNEELPDPTRRIVTVCEFGRISTLAAATLRDLGYTRVVALDGGMKAWREAAFPLVRGKSPS